MGTFTYDSSTAIDFDDRLLLHLQIVIQARLRRDQPFMFNCVRPGSVGGRTSIWIDRQIPLAFEYVTSSMPKINRRWIDELMETTYRTAGLQIVPESDAPASPAARTPAAGWTAATPK